MDAEQQKAFDAAIAAGQFVSNLPAIAMMFIAFMAFVGVFGLVIYLLLRKENNSQSQTQFNNDITRQQTGVSQTFGTELSLLRTATTGMVDMGVMHSKSMSVLAEGMTTLTAAQTGLTQAQTAVVASIAGLTSTLADALPAMVKALTENTDALKEVVEGQAAIVTGQAGIKETTDSIDDTLKAVAAIVQLLKVKFPVMAEYLLRPTPEGKVEMEAMAKPDAPEAAVTVTA